MKTPKVSLLSFCFCFLNSKAWRGLLHGQCSTYLILVRTKMEPVNHLNQSEQVPKAAGPSLSKAILLRSVKTPFTQMHTNGPRCRRAKPQSNALIPWQWVWYENQDRQDKIRRVWAAGIEVCLPGLYTAPAEAGTIWGEFFPLSFVFFLISVGLGWLHTFLPGFLLASSQQTS